MIKYYGQRDPLNFMDEGVGNSCKPTHKFFPLKQYRFADPCKVCLVKACCRTWCDEKYKNVYLRRWIKHFKTKLIRVIKYEKLYWACGIFSFIVIAFGVGVLLSLLMAMLIIILQGCF
jgi:hypothetical protein